MMKKENAVIKKGCHPRGMLSGISRIRLRKQTVSAYLHTTKQKGDSQQKPLGMTPYFTTAHGFTLIELLVVVLIIGILAAVAVPQYQKAVTKARFSQLLVYHDALIKAQKLYFLANEKYATSLDDLDIGVPEMESVNCSLYDPTRTTCTIRMKKSTPARIAAIQENYTTGQKICCAYGYTNFVAQPLCAQYIGNNEYYDGSCGSGEKQCLCYKSEQS